MTAFPAVVLSFRSTVLPSVSPKKGRPSTTRERSCSRLSLLTDASSKPPFPSHPSRHYRSPESDPRHCARFALGITRQVARRCRWAEPMRRRCCFARRTDPAACASRRLWNAWRMDASDLIVDLGERTRDGRERYRHDPGLIPLSVSMRRASARTHCEAEGFRRSPSTPTAPMFSVATRAMQAQVASRSCCRTAIASNRAKRGAIIGRCGKTPGRSPPISLPSSPAILSSTATVSRRCRGARSNWASGFAAAIRTVPAMRCRR